MKFINSPKCKNFFMVLLSCFQKKNYNTIFLHTHVYCSWSLLFLIYRRKLLASSFGCTFRYLRLVDLVWESGDHNVWHGLERTMVTYLPEYFRLEALNLHNVWVTSSTYLDTDLDPVHPNISPNTLVDKKFVLHKLLNFTVG